MTLRSTALFSCSGKPTNLPVHFIATDTGITRLPSDTTKKHYLALGDSYTIGQSVKVNERFPAQLVKRLLAAGFKVAEADIIATSGWTTANLLEAINNKSTIATYDMVTLLIGVNNQYQGISISQYRKEFIALLQKAIVFSGNRPNRVFVLSIPDYSVTPFANKSDKGKIAREIDAFNLVNKGLATAFHVQYVDITGESRKAASDHSLIAYDDLHFSGKEHSVWAALLTPLISRSLQ